MFPIATPIQSYLPVKTEEELTSQTFARIAARHSSRETGQTWGPAVGDGKPSEKRRSKRVMLQMTVKVIAETVERTTVEEEARTFVVNAHGGLVKMKRELKVGQPIVLVNPKTGVQQASRVVRVEDTDPEFFAMAFEFEQPNPGFWPVIFPPSDWG